LASIKLIRAARCFGKKTKNIAVKNGLFSVLLGDKQALPLKIFNGQELFLGITLAGDAEMTHANALPTLRMPSLPKMPRMPITPRVPTTPRVLIMPRMPITP
jgi:hypothetical protein